MNDSAEALIAGYRHLAEQHGDYKETANHVEANRVHQELTRLFDEIKRIEGLVHQLQPLLGDPNPWVRLWAAAGLRDYHPDIAEQTLNKLVVDDEGLTGLEAMMLLDLWSRR